MRQYIILALFLCMGLSTAPINQAHAAKNVIDRYIDPSVDMMTEYLSRYQLLDMDNLTVFSEYMRLTDCALYQTIHDNQFQQTELKQILQQKITANSKKISNMYVRVPFLLYALNYDFDTQSIDITPESQLKNVNTIEIISVLANTCGTKGLLAPIETVPTQHVVRLHFPISLYRIPLRKDLAQTVFQSLELRTAGYETRIVYGYFYIHIEPIEPEVISERSAPRAYYRGQVNYIDLFTDQARQKLLKRLDLISAY